MDNFNRLSPEETERLACLAEECAEVIQIVGKILRHGYADSSPEDTTHTNNRKRLEQEMGDVRYWMIEMCNKGDVSKEAVHHNAELKGPRVKQWLHHQGEAVCAF